ncbi:MAG: crossover junction endodeoxyribonuclease RuvC [Rhodoluna sp.]|nr:crossover junction endodeoxyribonuclease RuvC [Rhodoluna sp.]
MASRLIMGVDPGLTRCGVGIIRELPGRKIEFVQVDTFRASLDLPLAERIGGIAREIETLIEKYQPNAIAIERVFAQANLRSVMGVAQISGVVLYLAQKHGIPVHMHTPSEVKAAVTGSGRAAKAQIGEAVKRLLKLPEVPKPADSADALAIAITHSWRGVSADVSAAAPTKAQAAWLAAERASKAKTKG